MSRAGRGGRPPARRPWVLAVLGVAAGGAVVGLAVLARERSERRLQQEAVAESVARRALEAEPEEAADPVVDRLVAAAEPADASAAALDAAAHALLVRERFEEADALVARTLASFPTDAEAVIHDAVLRGVAGETAAARQQLERLADGKSGWEASLFLAGFALREGDEVAGLRSLRRVAAEAPAAEVTPALRAEIAELEARVGAPLSANKRPQKQP
ncbi:MAG: hypothetical protein ACLQDQ_01950 [Myxococcaceae bacterium]